ncbi:transcription factor bHLH118-like [Lycium barbarum]|uniref:transcription factor bHLH118-like n=1 Tax=Lycium barbarum TaxID=112863 RepID=UPI00293EF523|nr:transcription factor bHLH118-like [Lycium barbarum]
MDDCDQFDYGQLDQLFNFISSTSPPPPPLTTHRKQDLSISLQTQSSKLVTSHVTKMKPIANVNHHVIKKKPIITTTTIDDQVQDPHKEKEKKKVIRREVERQRRRDMAKLYQRLRLLIPSKYLMGKRSISDHLEEIVDYVKDLRKNIEDLETKRQKLKEMRNNITCSSNLHSQLAPSSSSMKLSGHDINGNDDEDRIRVNSCNEGVEISVKGGLPLSKVLKVLMKEGLIINSCVSSTANQRLLHIIQSKVNTREDIDLARLRFKLMSLSYKL